MAVTSRYLGAWEGFWRDAPEEPGSVIWDAEPALGAERHLTLFRPHLADPALPVVDLGCGNGTQTASSPSASPSSSESTCPPPR